MVPATTSTPRLSLRDVGTADHELLFAGLRLHMRHRAPPPMARPRERYDATRGGDLGKRAGREVHEYPRRTQHPRASPFSPRYSDGAEYWLEANPVLVHHPRVRPWLRSACVLTRRLRSTFIPPLCPLVKCGSTAGTAAWTQNQFNGSQYDSANPRQWSTKILYHIPAPAIFVGRCG